MRNRFLWIILALAAAMMAATASPVLQAAQSPGLHHIMASSSDPPITDGISIHS
jgi:hypothetical protein